MAIMDSNSSQNIMDKDMDKKINIKEQHQRHSRPKTLFQPVLPNLSRLWSIKNDVYRTMTLGGTIINSFFMVNLQT